MCPHVYLQSQFHMEMGKEKCISAVSEKTVLLIFTFNQEKTQVYVWSEKPVLLNANTSLVLCFFFDFMFTHPSYTSSYGPVFDLNQSIISGPSTPFFFLQR